MEQVNDDDDDDNCMIRMLDTMMIMENLIKKREKK